MTSIIIITINHTIITIIMRDVKLETGRGVGLVVFLPPKGPRGSNGAYSQRLTMVMMMMMMVMVVVVMMMMKMMKTFLRKFSLKSGEWRSFNAIRVQTATR